MFTALAGDRADVSDFVVLVTDGASDDSLQTIGEAFLAKRAHIHFVVVAIGRLVNEAELYTIANYPYSVNYLPAADLRALDNLTQPTRDLVCNSRCRRVLSQLRQVRTARPDPTQLDPTSPDPTRLKTIASGRVGRCEKIFRVGKSVNFRAFCINTRL